ncbi:MAG TPA: hypothetical protein VGM78_08530, partial [Ilumatobacteraceae bacterium]
MSRRTRRVAVATVFVAAAATTGGVLATRDRHGHDAVAAAVDAQQTSYATVVKKDLTRTEQLPGTVGHGDQTPLNLSGGGVITHLPAVDAVIKFGQPIAEVDGEPVILLQGDRPAWRTLA